MLRNSLDHGVETPAAREQKVKPRAGTILIDAAAGKEFLTLKIVDDGAGIDPEKIKKVAVKKGVITTEAALAMGKAEALNLIFTPGFSSAEQVTEVSGRGVGMDVVLTNIRKAKGAIDVTSEIDQGTTITIKLPPSMSVFLIRTLAVTVGVETYLVPMEYVAKVITATREMLISYEAGTELANYRGEVLPVLRLSRVLHAVPGAPPRRLAEAPSHGGLAPAPLLRR
jgi:two-component system chemotaxis sensor kinase CheA